MLGMKQTRSGLVVELGADGVEKKREEVAVLFLAGSNCGPHPLVIALACFAPSALCNAAVDHAMADLLFAVVIGRLQTLGEHEPKVVLRQIILARRCLVSILHNRKPRSEVRGLLCGRRMANHVQKAVAVCEHRTTEALGRHLVTAASAKPYQRESIPPCWSPAIYFRTRPTMAAASSINCDR
jgi:hypothetical protein